MRILIISSILAGAFGIPAPYVDVVGPGRSAIGPVVSAVASIVPIADITPFIEGFKVPVARRAVTRATGDVDPAVYFGQLHYTIQKYIHSFKLPFSVSDVAKKIKYVPPSHPIQE